MSGIGTICSGLSRADVAADDDVAAAEKNAERRRRREREREIVCGARLHSSPRERVYAPARVAHMCSRARARGRAPRDPATAPGGASGGAARFRPPPTETASRHTSQGTRSACGCTPCTKPRGVGPAGRVAPRRWLVDDEHTSSTSKQKLRRGADEEPPERREPPQPSHAIRPRLLGPTTSSSPTPRVGVHACDAGAARVRVRVRARGGARPDDALVGVHVSRERCRQVRPVVRARSTIYYYTTNFFSSFFCARARGKAFRADLPFARVCLDDTRVVWSPTPASASRWCFTSHPPGRRPRSTNCTWAKTRWRTRT